MPLQPGESPMTKANTIIFDNIVIMVVGEPTQDRIAQAICGCRWAHENFGLITATVYPDYVCYHYLFLFAHQKLLETFGSEGFDPSGRTKGKDWKYYNYDDTKGIKSS
jgi:hypothetical protein